MLSRSLLFNRELSLLLLLSASTACGGELQVPNGGANAGGSPGNGGAGAASNNGGAPEGAGGEGANGGGPNGGGGAGQGGQAQGGGGQSQGGGGQSQGGGGQGQGGEGGQGGGQPDGPAPVDLGTAGNFVILSKSGIDTVPLSVITGDIGVSPIAAIALTGFSLILDASGTFSTSSQVVGNVYAADYTPPTPSNLTTAISDMETAYTDAAGRPTPDFIDLAGGELGGLTLVPGLYNWQTGVLISSDVTLNGGPEDTWIFQISGGITEAPNVSVNLSGGALPENIFWQAAGAVALDTGAHFEGIVLASTQITLGTGASVNGRLLSQTAVTLNAATVTQP